MSEAVDVEALLRAAFAPVEPPAALGERLEATLAGLAELAADELESWELASMRDPRNWVRPAAAVAVGTAAGAALVVLRARNRHKRRTTRSGGVVDFAERTAHDLAIEARRLLDSRNRSS
jgi:hypothetical protein